MLNNNNYHYQKYIEKNGEITWFTRTTRWSWSWEIIMLHTVVLPDAVPPATPYTLKQKAMIKRGRERMKRKKKWQIKFYFLLNSEIIKPIIPIIKGCFPGTDCRDKWFWTPLVNSLTIWDSIFIRSSTDTDSRLKIYSYTYVYIHSLKFLGKIEKTEDKLEMVNSWII